MSGAITVTVQWRTHSGKSSCGSDSGGVHTLAVTERAFMTDRRPLRVAVGSQSAKCRTPANTRSLSSGRANRCSTEAAQHMAVASVVSSTGASSPLTTAGPLMASCLPKTIDQRQLPRRSPNASPSHFRWLPAWLWTFMRLVVHLLAAGPQRGCGSQDRSNVGSISTNLGAARPAVCLDSPREAPCTI